MEAGRVSEQALLKDFTLRGGDLVRPPKGIKDQGSGPGWGGWAGWSFTPYTKKAAVRFPVRTTHPQVFDP